MRLSWLGLEIKGDRSKVRSRGRDRVRVSDEERVDSGPPHFTRKLKNSPPEERVEKYCALDKVLWQSIATAESYAHA